MTAPHPLPSPPRTEPLPIRWNTFAIVGFICAFVMAPLGLAFSIVGFVQTGRSHEQGRGLSLTGIIIGAVFTLAALAALVTLIWFGVMFVPYGQYLRTH